MPTISPLGRPQIGGQSEAQAPIRNQIKATTGMNLPPSEATKPIQTGQSGITEETQIQAVTLSPQLTALARKQQKFQAEIQAQRDKEAQWEKEKSNYVSKDSFKAKAQQNAAEALAELGYTYDEITNLLLNQSQGDDPVKSLEAKIDKLQKAQEEGVNKQYDATLRQYRAETDQIVSADPKSFHFIKKGGHEDAVVQHIVDTWKEDDTKVLTVEQAAKEIEEFLRAEAKEKADLLRELDPPAEETQGPQKKTLPPPQQAAPAKTLTRQVEATPTRTYGQFQHLSMKERIAQSIARTQR